MSLGEWEPFIIIDHSISLLIAKGRFWNAGVMGHFDNVDTGKVRKIEVIEDIIHVFVDMDTMSPFYSPFEGRDHRGCEIEGGQFETSCRSQFWRKMRVYGARRHS
jgi:hypothetical protein